MKPTDLLVRMLARLGLFRLSRGGEVAVPIQSGALPWRVKRKSPQVLLVTGKRSGRWIIPKGWPMAGKSLADSAAQEAYEEAGVTGKVDPTPIGSFRHVKERFLLGALEVDIRVHPLAVKKELGDWPERGERSRKWFALEEAAAKVDSKELGRLIVEFGESLVEKRERA